MTAPPDCLQKRKKERKNNRCGESFFYTTITVGTFSLLILFFQFVVASHI